LLNGKMRSNKIHVFHDLIDWLNIKHINLNIKKRKKDDSPLNSHSWLAGFIS
jgi:hypothetical protein